MNTSPEPPTDQTDHGPTPLVYIAGDPQRMAKLPELLRALTTHARCEQCGRPVAFHTTTRDELAQQARRAGRRLVTYCDDCGRRIIRDGAAIVPVRFGTLARDIRRAIAERQ